VTRVNHIPVKAIIFDMDGIIVDSEPVQLESFNEVLKPYNIQLSENDFKGFIGMTQVEIFSSILNAHTIDKSIDQLRSEKKSIYTKLIKDELFPMPGLAELIEWIEQTPLKKGIASGSPLDDIHSVLDHIHLRDRFDCIQSSLHLPHGKPFPDVYLHVAEGLNVSPAACIVLEDTAIGVEAGKKAGMICIAVPNALTSHQNFSHSHYVVKDLFAARLLIESLVNTGK